jgi:hypothetical protein
MLTLALAVVLQSSFPLPTIDQKAIAVTDKQKVFRLPLRFDKVRAFYDEQLKGQAEVTLRVRGVSGERVLTISNKNKADTWREATVTEKEMETVVSVTPVLRMEETQVTGNGRPLVEFIFSRSPEVDKAVEAIGRDHLENIRK